MPRSRFRALSSAATLVLALVGCLAPSPLFAQQAGSTALASAVASPKDPAVELHLERARALSLLGNFDEARAEFETAAKLQREIGVLPVEAMWSIAEIYYGQERDLEAADVLAELAREAELRGDPVVQAKALIEAAVLYKTQARHEEASRLASRLGPLRNSPYLSDELRTQIDTRISTH